LIIVISLYLILKESIHILVQVRSFVGDSDSIETNINKWIADESPDEILGIKLVAIPKTTLHKPEFFALVLYQNPD